jgi:hypothetical protein
MSQRMTARGRWWPRGDATNCSNDNSNNKEEQMTDQQIDQLILTSAKMALANYGDLAIDNRQDIIEANEKSWINRVRENATTNTEDKQ